MGNSVSCKSKWEQRQTKYKILFNKTQMEHAGNILKAVEDKNISKFKKLLGKNDTEIARNAILKITCFSNMWYHYIDMIGRPYITIHPATPFELVTAHYWHDMLEYLLKCGVNGNTALITYTLHDVNTMNVAVFKCVNVLLSADNIDVNTRIGSNQTPLCNVAAVDKKNAILKLLLKHKHIDVNTRLTHSIVYTPLMIACKALQVRNVHSILQHKHVQVNIQNRHGETALMLLVIWHRGEKVLPCARQLLTNGANVLQMKHNGNTALTYIEKYHSAVTIFSYHMTALLQHGRI
jgi:hypothetical protein